MIISRTPFRISLFGGGTDYPTWFRQYGGAVLGTAIDKYCYISVRRLPPFFEHKHRIVYSKVELVQDIKKIQHPAVRGVLAEMRVDGGLEIHHDADLPARSGLGSSSSFTVGLLNVMHAGSGRMIHKRDLSKEAIRIEQEVLKESVGCQDQIWAAYGGFNKIEFFRDGSFTVTPVILRTEHRTVLQQSMMLFFTGFSRLAPEIAKDQIDNITNRHRHLSIIQHMVKEATDILQGDRFSVRDLGNLLHESWQLKRELAATVSTPQIDDIYEAGREAGALGGKLLGAGGGGFMLFFVEPDKRAKVRERLKKLIDVSVGYDNDGSKIVVYEPDGLSHA